MSDKSDLKELLKTTPQIRDDVKELAADAAKVESKVKNIKIKTMKI
jgi:hypothetical protein|tara:strand:+ start:3819 stop:3956 length:138 start_codon:yes stop_codon:yes gene_type:complete